MLKLKVTEFENLAEETSKTISSLSGQKKELSEKITNLHNLFDDVSTEKEQILASNKALWIKPRASESSLSNIEDAFGKLQHQLLHIEGNSAKLFASNETLKTNVHLRDTELRQTSSKPEDKLNLLSELEEELRLTSCSLQVSGETALMECKDTNLTLQERMESSENQHTETVLELERSKMLLKSCREEMHGLREQLRQFQLGMNKEARVAVSCVHLNKMDLSIKNLHL